MQGHTSSISKRVRHSIQQVLPGTTHSFLTGTLLIGALAAFLASCCCCWACCCMAASLGSLSTWRKLRASACAAAAAECNQSSAAQGLLAGSHINLIDGNWRAAGCPETGGKPEGKK